MQLDAFEGTLDSDDPLAAARAIERFLLGDGPGWDELARMIESVPLREDWVETHVGTGVRASRKSPRRYLQLLEKGLTELRWGEPGYPLEAFEALLAGLPFHVLEAHRPVRSMDSPWRDVPSVPLLAHGSDLGWAVWLKGRGHDHLPSRRWLEHGPWRYRPLPNDISMLQLCDLAASPAEQVAQAAVARDHFAGRGGPRVWIPVYPRPEQGRPKSWTFPGVYDRDRRVWRGRATDLSWDKLNLYVIWRARCREDPVEPVDTFVFEFADEAEAQPHLYRLWLCEFEAQAAGRPIPFVPPSPRSG